LAENSVSNKSEVLVSIVTNTARAARDRRHPRSGGLKSPPEYVLVGERVPNEGLHARKLLVDLFGEGHAVDWRYEVEIGMRLANVRRRKIGRVEVTARRRGVLKYACDSFTGKMCDIASDNVDIRGG
jgi:hypothetical protein